MERRLDEMERKIDRILKELESDGNRDEEGGAETDAPVYDELTLDEAGFESY